MPVDFGGGVISVVVPGHKFDFGYIKPRAVFWGMMDFQTRKQASGLLGRESLVECSRLAGIKVITNEDHLFGVGISDSNLSFLAILSSSAGSAALDRTL